MYLGKYRRVVKKKKKEVFASPVKSDVLKTSLVLRVIIRKFYFLWQSWASVKHSITSKSAHHFISTLPKYFLSINKKPTFCQ